MGKKVKKTTEDKKIEVETSTTPVEGVDLTEDKKTTISMPTNNKGLKTIDIEIYNKYLIENRSELGNNSLNTLKSIIASIEAINSDINFFNNSY